MILANDIRRGQRGFTLIEVLIALLITSVGLLGLLKIQALALSSTREAGSRSLIASQVESLTAAMQANPLYWSLAKPADGSAALGAPPSPITISGAATITPAALASTVDCSTISGTCTPTQMAASDLQTWARSMYAQFPTYNATVRCSGTVPVNCTIYVTWTENQVGMNATTSAATNQAASAALQSFSVYVQP